MEMRDWIFHGPDRAKMSLAAVARYFGYEPRSLKDLIRSGHFPPPRGQGANEYYTGADVAAIIQFFWPLEARRRDREATPGNAQTRRGRRR